jgi:hypothetical protein
MVLGDYPALAKASGFSHSGGYCCHYCFHLGLKNAGLQRCVHGDFFRWLPHNHVQREGKTNAPPEMRTHHGSVRAGAYCAAEERRQYASGETQHVPQDGDGHPLFKGVKFECELYRLHLFDVVWDMPMDMMHIIDGIFKRHIIPTLKGARKPKPPKFLLTGQQFAPEERNRRRTANMVARTDYKVALEVTRSNMKFAYYIFIRILFAYYIFIRILFAHIIRLYYVCHIILSRIMLRIKRQMLAKWTTSKGLRNRADQRSLEVTECEGFTSGRRVFQNTGSLKAADWLHLVDTGALHVLLPMLAVNTKARKALLSIVRALRLLLHSNSDIDVLADPQVDYENRKCNAESVKAAVVELLCFFEDGMPGTSHPSIVHLLIHVPDCIFRWNSVRNTWCFYNERS